MRIDYFSPVYRHPFRNDPNETLRKVKNALEWLYSSPFARETIIAHKQSIWTNTYSICLEREPIPLWKALLKVCFLAGCIFSAPRLAAVGALVGCYAKYQIRSKETYEPFPEINSNRDKVNPPPTPEENLKKWCQKWQAEIYFPLFAFGIRELDSNQLENYGDQEKIAVKIGEETQEYSQKFLMQVPYFNVLLNQNYGWKEKKNGIITLSSGFYLSHADLKKVEGLFLGNTLQELDLEAMEHFGFLNINPNSSNVAPLLDFSNLQRTLENNQSEEELKTRYSEAVLKNAPSLKCPSMNVEFIPLTDKPSMEKDAICTYLKNVISDKESDREKHYKCNVIIDSYAHALHLANNDAKQKNPHQSIPIINIAEKLLEITQEIPEVKKWVTILTLPPLEDYSKLSDLLCMLPNLLWLQINIFSKPISLDNFPENNNLRVLNIDGQTLDRKALEEKFRNIEILELS